MTKNLIAALSLLLVAGAFAANGQGNITINLDGVRNDNGHILAVAINTENPEAMEADQVKSREGSMTIVFADVEDGTYMISLFHDENDNMTMDLSDDGMPAEGFAIIEGSDIMMGYTPPMVTVSGEDVAIDLQMFYFD